MTTPGAVQAPDVPRTEPVRVLVYSDDATTREEVVLAVGRRAAADLPRIEWTEVATHAAVVAAAESGRFTALVLDGEAAKVGGLGICRQLKAEVWECPPVVVLVGRPQDAWLAAWSEADAVVAAPIEPLELQHAVARVVRGRLS